VCTATSPTAIEQVYQPNPRRLGERLEPARDQLNDGIGNWTDEHSISPSAARRSLNSDLSQGSDEAGEPS